MMATIVSSMFKFSRVQCYS